MKPIWLAWVFLILAIKLPAEPIITVQPTNQVVMYGSNAIFSVSVSGTGPFTYQWQFNGTNLPNNIITTVVGNGTNAYSGDGGAAANASLNYPVGVALDANGNLFIADENNYRIRKVDTNGIIASVAGNGTSDFSGDGGLATNSSVSAAGLAVDAIGNLFIADIVNCRIRKVNTNGTIVTVAGNGDLSYANSSNGKEATNASLNATGVAVDNAGNLFVADAYNSLIHKVNTNGIITTVAGGGASSYSGNGQAATNVFLSYPSGVAMTTAKMFIAGNFQHRIYEVDTNGIITALAGNGTQGYSGDGGAATNAKLNTPFGLAVDTGSNEFFVERFNNCVRKVDPNGIITTVAGNGTQGYSGDGGAAANAQLNDPRGVAVDTVGNLFIADTGNQRIRKVAAFGSLPHLTLNNVTTNEAGNYSVIITGTQGSVTSSIAKLTVTITPTITCQPQPMAVTNGFLASFTVAAGGSPTLSYQWRFNGTNLPDATNSTFTLQNTFTENAGTYAVVVTNAYGCATSNPAMLMVLPLGITTPTIRRNGQFQFSFDTATGVNYTVEFSTNLMQWIPVVSLGGVGVPMIVIDPNTVGSQQRFYRVELSPR